MTSQLKAGDPRHGTPAQQQTQYLAGCYCQLCERGRRHHRGMSKRRRMGQYQTVDVAPVLVHIDRLMAAGWRQVDICRRSGVSQGTVSDILHGVGSKMTVPNAEAIITLKPADAPRGRTVSSVGVIRRLTALVALGYYMREVCARAGLDPLYGANLMADRRTNGRTRAHVDAADAIDRVFRELCMKPGPHNRARNIAAARGWVPPLAWDEDEMDDPDAKPHIARHPRRLPQDGVVDNLAVEKRTAGDRGVPLNFAEQAELVRRWLDSGKSPNACEKVTGVNVYRVLKRGQEGQEDAA